MKTEIRINDNNRTIELTKKFATAASRYGTREYEDLQEARRAYPKYKVVTKKATKKKDSFKGLTYDYMREYIKNHDNEEKTIMTEFCALCGKDANGRKIEMAEATSYGEIKAWFLSQYSEFKEYRNNVKEILKKVA